jgi:hypothetical protein
MAKIAFFVSAHGFGHATRACAVMAALRTLSPSVQFEIFTLVPRWLFEASIPAGFTLHPEETDIGLAQSGPLDEDIPLTLQRLDAFLPFRGARLGQLAEQVREAGCAGVVCDISPLGLAVARQAGLPSVLVENFTWDWIYSGYVAEAPQLQRHIDYLRWAFDQADYHVQTTPAYPRPPVHLLTAPVSRLPKTSRDDVRGRLGIPRDAAAVLVTMGGFSEDFGFLDQLAGCRPFHFILPGNSWLRQAEGVERRGNLRLLPQGSAFYHPDLVWASDAVIGKAGYSTVAETYQAGVPFGYVLRSRSPESGLLHRFIASEMPGFEVPEAAFRDGSWLARLPDLAAQPRRPRPDPNGADQAAAFIWQHVVEGAVTTVVTT